ncbi:DUF3011 domain-containing protein [Dyella telluris]|uniref:DUF3011 domain-containing protein n=2 Tax=Dyella telluris TaxID=2763498 RepID=A0A7G8QA46_9GAMM|nr:DUF3011 domain-containing protein [Dyella telluris]
MKKALAVFLLMFGGAAAGPAVAGVPFLNATCPGGIELHADDGGPVFVNGREASLKRFSDSYYEARDGQSGTTISISTGDGGTQLSYTARGGAHGVCQMAEGTHGQQARSDSHDGHDNGPLPSKVTCESSDAKQVWCDMDTRGNVHMVKQLSHTDCREGQNWGLSNHSVWVNGGCRAVFENVSRNHDHAADGNDDAGNPALAACNSRKGSQGAVVTSVPVGNDYKELIIDYPDGRFVCMLRNDGGVQSLTRTRGQ